MCGICGEINFDGAPASSSSIGTMMLQLEPRGPDAGGIVIRSHVGFGHQRLKIIDLSNRAEQPMTDPALGLTIVFNGCIYNYKDLRVVLQQKGHTFFSNGDTEVIMRAYAEWGIDCVKHLHGMFAFAIYDRNTGRLILARDRLGIKPLYLAPSVDGRRLRFASSLPALLKAGDVDRGIDPVGLHHYMTFHAVVPPPHTILKGVRKLPPATVAIFEADGRRKDHIYWDVNYRPTTDERSYSTQDWQERVLDALRTAVKRRMVADVPVGVLLSGGVDSSLIVGLLAEAGQQNLKTFSVGFEEANGEKGDEFQYSDLIAEHFDTDHTKTFVPSEHLLETLPKTFAAMSEPMVSYDNAGFYLLSEQVSKHVKVVQSGQGADEIFAGYHWYPPMMQSNDAVGNYADVFFDRDHRDYGELINSEYVQEDFSRAFVQQHFDKPGASAPVDKALRIDTQVMLVDDPVKRVDNMTMAWGLEARVPFLDHELVELAARVPAREKVRNEGKGILKDVARRVIPDSVIDRPKGYFPVPALKYIDGPYLDLVRDAVNSTAARNRGLYQSAYIDKLIDDPVSHITPLRGSMLWQVALLEMWLQQHSV